MMGFTYTGMTGGNSRMKWGAGGVSKIGGLTSPETVGTSQFGSLGRLTDVYEQERQEKYSAGLSNLQDMMKLFGSGYGKGVERTALAGANEDLISRGLGGTTRPVAMSVGMKANLEDQRRSKLAEVMAMMAQFTQQSAPSAPLVSSLASGANEAYRNPGRLSAYFQNYDTKFAPAGYKSTGPMSMSPAGRLFS